MTSIFKVGSLYKTKTNIKLFDAATHDNGGFLVLIPKNSLLLLIAKYLEEWDYDEEGKIKTLWAKKFYFENKTFDDTTETLTGPDLYFEEIKTDGI